MSLHSRRAATEVLDALEKYDGAGTPILHWFSGTQRELRRAIELGCWFSVGPAMLIGNKGRAIASQLPRDRVLTESDGPFAQVDQRPALPWDVANAVSLLGGIWSESAQSIEQRLMDNALRLTGSKF